MKKIVFVILIVMSMVSCNSNNKQHLKIDKEQIKKEVWSVIEIRFNAWKDNDIDGYLQTQHSDWKRWESGSNKLVDYEGYKEWWPKAKANETVLEMEVKLEDIKISPLGDAALVHFISIEKFKWTGKENARGWKPGDIFTGAILRWSETLIKEDGKWLSIGGHKDMSRPEGVPE